MPDQRLSMPRLRMWKRLSHILHLRYMAGDAGRLSGDSGNSKRHATSALHGAYVVLKTPGITCMPCEGSALPGGLTLWFPSPVMEMQGRAPVRVNRLAEDLPSTRGELKMGSLSCISVQMVRDD
jgi:hypothetical protein